MIARRLPIAILLAFAAAATARVDAGFPSDNVTLLSHIPADAFPGSPARGNDCWGYVSPSGREYALMGMRNALNVVESASVFMLFILFNLKVKYKMTRHPTAKPLHRPALFGSDSGFDFRTR